jgi:RimJ/RimL family protein N-acetyltransferase
MLGPRAGQTTGDAGHIACPVDKTGRMCRLAPIRELSLHRCKGIHLERTFYQYRQEERGISGERQTEVAIRPWSDSDLPLLERLMGDPAMTEHLGGPETLEKIRERHERYCQTRDPGAGGMFVIVVGPGSVAAGSVGYWERDWAGQRVWETGWSVLPEFQGQGVASRATAAVVATARADGQHRFIHAYPAVDNGPSNAICRKVGFVLQGEVDFEYPPGNFMRCNDWCLDLFAETSESTSARAGG